MKLEKSVQIRRLKWLPGAVTNREHPYVVSTLVNFENNAVDVWLDAIEEMAQLPFHLARFRGAGAAVRSRFKGVHRSFQAVVPARCVGRSRRILLKIQGFKIADRASG